MKLAASGGGYMRRGEFVNSYFDAWNHHDPDGVAAHLAQNGRYCDIPQHIELAYEELIADLKRLFARSKYRYELTSRVFTSRSAIAYQYRMILRGDGGSTNDTIYHGAEFITLRDDHAALMIADYYDVAGARQTRLASSPVTQPEQFKYVKSGLSDQRSLEYKNRLDEVMRSQELFLQPGLTLPKLAAAVDCSVNHLSQVINSGFNMRFSDYLNKYRVDCAMDVMTSAEGRRQSILDIAYSVGFNSVSAFYSAFKKHVGQTPAQYRREQLKQTSLPQVK
ncbi:MAG: helix-turn-helix domain-containing protein [Woeseiaceae bacterium]|nr:helix-turn-helix domain-containing protein [Woeseiaceae bacterium]